MTTRTLFYAAFERLLAGLGFIRLSVAGLQAVFREAETDTLVILPRGESRDIMNKTHLAAVRRLFVERGFEESRGAFNDLITPARSA